MGLFDTIGPNGRLCSTGIFASDNPYNRPIPEAHPMTLKTRITRTIRKVSKALTPLTDQDYAIRKYRKYRDNHNPPTCGVDQ